MLLFPMEVPYDFSLAGYDAARAILNRVELVERPVVYVSVAEADTARRLGIPYVVDTDLPPYAFYLKGKYQGVYSSGA